MSYKLNEILGKIMDRIISNMNMSITYEYQFDKFHLEIECDNLIEYETRLSWEELGNMIDIEDIDKQRLREAVTEDEEDEMV